MREKEKTIYKNENTPFPEGTSEFIPEELLFAESVYAALPVGLEFYDVNGTLRSINTHALQMYGVEDKNTVIGTVNLFNSPYMEGDLEARIRSGKEVITLEFEYDFARIKDAAYFTTTTDRNTMIYEVKVFSLKNKQGEIIGHVLLANDVTSAKEVEFHTEEDKKNLEMAMDAANMSSWVYDVDKQLFSPLYGDPIVKNTMTLEALLNKLHPQDSVLLPRLFTQLIKKEIQYGNTTVRLYNEEEKQYRIYETRMRLSSEHFGKLQIIGTELDVTDKILMAKRTQELATKRELAMQVSGIVHWDYDVRTKVFEAYNDPINDYANERLVTIRQFMDVLHPEDYSVFNDFIQSMNSGKNVTANFNCRIMTKYDKRWQHCSLVSLPFDQDDAGNIIRYTGFRQDISKIHQLNEEIRERNYKMELTFKTVGMSYWDFDVSTRLFKAFNDSVNDFNPEKTITPEEYIVTTHPEDIDVINKYINHMLQGIDQDFSFKTRSMTKWDKEWQSYVITGIQSEKNKKGEVVRYTGIRFNNTKWEKITQELKSLKEKAELSDRLKSAFLANMSHEIRTPLNAIVGFSDLLVECDDSDEKKEYAGIIQSNNELLLRLINDILDLSKIESGILERKRAKFNLATVCQELYTMIQQKITNPDVEFILGNSGPDCIVLLDSNRLKQVWMNYLTNAVKCTRSGHIKMGYSVEKDAIRFYVEDTGVGIPFEVQDRVFGRFQKLNDFAQGTGLGLAICKAIVEGAGGEVGFTSTPGVGTTFWARIPCDVEMGKGAAPVSLPKPKKQETLNGLDKKDLKVLLAEDDDSNYLLIHQLLKDYNLTRVVNGVEAVNKVREGNFDFVIMDMKMPLMGGLEAVRKIREFNSEIIIVALTANAFDADRAKALEAGCNEFLTKPLNKELLLDLLFGK